MTSKEALKNDEYYGIWYAHNVQLLWGTRDWPLVIVISIITLLLVKPDLLTVLAVILSISIGIPLGPYTAESLYRSVKRHLALYAEAGRRYNEVFRRSKYFRVTFEEPQLFFKAGLWAGFLVRLIVLGTASLALWYFLVIKLGVVRNSKFSMPAGILMFYLTFRWHWLAALWWWKYKVLGPEKCRELYELS
jgi:hypothetical protein